MTMLVAGVMLARRLERDSRAIGDFALHRSGTDPAVGFCARETHSDHAPVGPISNGDDSDGWQDWPRDESVIA